MHKSVLDLLDKHYYLTDTWDASLENDLDKVQEAIQQQDPCPLDEILKGWWENTNYGEDVALENLMEEIKDRFKISEERAREFVREHQDELLNEIRERDASTPLDDLMRHTREICFFYDLNYSVYQEVCLEPKEIAREIVGEIKKILKIKTDKYDDRLWMMVEQGCIGGESRLVVYFLEDIKPMMQLDGKNVIHFKNPMVALIDTGQGSGDNTDLPGHEFWVPFDPANLWIDKTLHYSYVYDVCGMVHDWCDCTRVTFKTDKRVKPVKAGSSLWTEVEQEKVYQKRFKEGKCTFGDMDIRRHRNTYYINDFPCGTKCPNCGTFWID